jgi:rod shape-determining protein MreC
MMGAGSIKIAVATANLTAVLRRRRSQTLLVVLTLVAVTLMTLDLSDHGSGPVARARDGALMLFAPVQHAVSVVVRPVTRIGRWIDDQRRMHTELARARQAMDRLAAAEIERDDLRAENAELRRLLGMRDEPGLSTVGARVLGTVPGGPGSSVLIDAGSRDGLAAGMTVLGDDGVAGRLVTVTGHYARVELVTSPAARYAVRVVAGRQPGRLRGRGDGGLHLELNDPHAVVPAGAAVVTRAFEGSNVPDGLSIGTVAEPAADGRSLRVRPAVDAATLDIVQVVTGPARPSGVDSDVQPSPAALRARASASEPVGGDLPDPPRPSEQ